MVVFQTGELPIYLFQKTCDYLFVFTEKTAYEVRISVLSSDVCSSDLDKRIEMKVCLAARRRVSRFASLRGREEPAKQSRRAARSDFAAGMLRRCTARTDSVQTRSSADGFDVRAPRHDYRQHHFISRDRRSEQHWSRLCECGLPGPYLPPKK